MTNPRLFGYPQAHEDDAVRACRAGLSIIDAIFRLNATVALEVRIACATGLVLVGDLSGEYFGDARAIMRVLQPTSRPGYKRLRRRGRW